MLYCLDSGIFRNVSWGPGCTFHISGEHKIARDWVNFFTFEWAQVHGPHKFAPCCGESRQCYWLTESNECGKMFVCRIVVDNLDAKCTKSDLEVAFRPFGVISSLNYSIVDNASLKYSCPDAARLAIQRMNLVPLRGCCISVSISACLWLNGIAKHQN